MFVAQSFPVLSDTSVLEDGRTLSQAFGAGPGACLVGASGWDREGHDWCQAISEQDQGGCS